MFRQLASSLCVVIAVSSAAQFIHDPYQDHSGDSMAIRSYLASSFDHNYVGEYQIHMKDWPYWIDPIAKDVSYRIEVVSFPFTPKDEAVQAGDRTMVMPQLDSYGPIESGIDCSGWGWERNVPGQANPRNLMRVINGPMTSSNAGANNVMSRPAALASIMFHEASMAGCGPDSTNRQWLPHTVLKHTLIVHDENGTPLDSVAWVYDNTRGRMRYYPFAEWMQGQSQYWDVIFRPVLLYDPANGGHRYDARSNGNWYVEDGQVDSTANYFPPVPPGASGLVYPLDPSTETYPSAIYTHPPPFALLEAPLLNIDGDGYAGYEVDGGIQKTLFAGDTAWQVPHIYVIDKPIDLLTINTSERIIYNPSSAVIDLDTAYGAPVLVFPSGYTFKTVHGLHPSLSAVQDADPDGLYPHPLLAPVPSTLGPTSSTYRVNAGNTLLIEPCVTIMDALIIVDSGATVIRDTTSLAGNFTFQWEPGSNDVILPPSGVKPCHWNCYTAAFYDATSITIAGLETWSTSNLPGASVPGHLVIRDTLRIPQDQRLIIEPGVVLEFGPRGRIIVERGGQLNAEGAVFTSACQTMWQGMEVWGETDHAQYPFQGNTATGRAILEGTSIEHARCAVRVFKPGSGDHNGGVLWATDCIFNNNRIGIEIRPTRNMFGGVEQANICKVDGCTFETNAFLLDPAYGDGVNRGAGAEHIRLVDVHHVRIANNTFSTAVPGHTFPPHLRGTGIMSFNAAFLALNNTFNGLSQGLWAANFPGFRTVRVRNNTFTNTIHSVILQGTHYAEVTRNEIEVPRTPNWAYAPNDVERGCNLPVGIYLLGSTEYNVEDNDIEGSEPDSSSPIPGFSYGIITSESMYADRSEVPGLPPDPEPPDTIVSSLTTTASVFYNRVSGLSVGIQMEGDNRGAYSPSSADSAGYGLVVECNDLSPGYGNWWLDMAVVGNYIEPGVTYEGKLRDQGDCDYQETQAGNAFSSCWGSPLTAAEQLFFDSNADSVNFRYSDEITMLPSCENIPQAGMQSCLWGNSRNCISTLDCDAPCLYARRVEVRMTLQAIEEALADTSDPDAVAEKLRQRAYYRAQQRLIHGAELRYYLEVENMDSVFAVIKDEGGGGELRELLYMYVEEDRYAEADSIIQLIIAAEGGNPSAHTELMMLRLSLANAQQSIADLGPSHRALLETMVAQDPLGASNAKALLMLAFGQTFKRIPWTVNDNVPGRALWRPALAVAPMLKLWPVPTNGVLNLECIADLNGIFVMDATGKLLKQWGQHGPGLIQLDVNELPEGMYLLRVESSTGVEHRVFTKVK